MNPCFCIPLRVGAMIIAVLELGYSLVILVLFGFGLAVLTFVKVSNSEDDDSDKDLQDAKNEVKSKGPEMFVFLGTATAVALVGTITVFMLFWGVLKRNVGLMKIWLIFKVFRLLIVIGLVIVPFVSSKVAHQFIVSELFSILVSFYFIWVVYALIDETKQTVRPQPN